MTTYTTAEIKQIAQTSEEQHIGLLTNCGASRDVARKIIAMSTDELSAGLAAVEGRTNKTASQEAMIAAARRELIIRQ